MLVYTSVDSDYLQNLCRELDCIAPRLQIWLNTLPGPSTRARWYELSGQVVFSKSDTSATSSVISFISDQIYSYRKGTRTRAMLFLPLADGREFRQRFASSRVNSTTNFLFLHNLVTFTYVWTITSLAAQVVLISGKSGGGRGFKTNIIVHVCSCRL